jgi:hypothetical protein
MCPLKVKGFNIFKKKKRELYNTMIRSSSILNMRPVTTKFLGKSVFCLWANETYHRHNMKQLDETDITGQNIGIC